MDENNNKITNKTFIKIPNSLFTIEKNELGEEIGVTIFKQIGTEGFTIWSYLLFTQGNQVSAQTSVKRIGSFLNRNKESRSKYIAKNGLNDYRSIKKYLNVLLKMDMIKLEQFINEEEKDLKQLLGEEINNNYFTNIRADEELFIEVNPLDDGKGFSIISSQLFFDYVHKIGHIGWSIYCLLFKNHNINYGNQDDDPYTMKNYGFANCSEEYISKILDRSRKTISEYISENKIIQTSLVRIFEQKDREWINNKTGLTEFKYMPNHYVVHAKYNPEDKYYIETNQNKEK